MAALRPHQEAALKQLESGKILCGGTGSGKSITSLFFFAKSVCKSEIGGKVVKPTRLIIITTARKRDSLEWEGELLNLNLTTDPETSWGGIQVEIDSWNNIKKYTHIRDAFFIFDEQRLVGNGTWVKNFLKIAEVNQWLMLSATPGDTWQDYIPVFLAHGFYKNRSDFLTRHAVYNRYAKYPKVDKWVGTKRLEQLRDSLLVDMPFARTTVRHEVNVTLPYDKALYKRVSKDRWNPWDDEPIQEIAKTVYLMRRVTYADRSRLDKLKELLAKHPRIIVFYNFDYELDILHELRGFPEWNVAEWNGHAHEPVPTSDRWVYLVQYSAGSEAWNCITSDTMVFYSQTYSHRMWEQAKGRIDRLNTPYVDLWYYNFKSTSGLELAIRSALSKKRRFTEAGFRKTLAQS